MSNNPQTHIPPREKLDRPLRKAQWAIRATELFIQTDLAADVQHGSRCAPGTRLSQEINLWLAERDRLQPELQAAEADPVNPSPQMLAALRQAWSRGHIAGFERGKSYAQERPSPRGNTDRLTDAWTVDLEAGE